MNVPQPEPRFLLTYPSMPPRGLFISLEGSDGSGKSSQIQILAAALRKKGLRVRVTGEPGGTPFGAKLRRILLDPGTGRLNPKSEAFLYEAARVEHLDKVILPALKSGTWVLCSRFSDSTLAYQGAARGLPISELSGLDRWATGGLKPDLTLILDLAPGLGLKRVRGRGKADRFEAEGLVFQKKVRAYFKSLSKREAERVKIVSAAGTRDMVFGRIWVQVSKFLERKHGR